MAKLVSTPKSQLAKAGFFTSRERDKSQKRLISMILLTGHDFSEQKSLPYGLSLIHKSLSHAWGFFL
ncbi:hypothetical protein AB6C54_24140, partial [Vibrio splendidus]